MGGGGGCLPRAGRQAPCHTVPLLSGSLQLSDTPKGERYSELLSALTSHKDRYTAPSLLGPGLPRPGAPRQPCSAPPASSGRPDSTRPVPSGSSRGRKSRSAKASLGCTCASHPRPPRLPAATATAGPRCSQTAGEWASRLWAPGGGGRRAAGAGPCQEQAGPSPLRRPPAPPPCWADKEGLLQLPFRAGQAWAGPGAQAGQAAAAAAGQEGAGPERGAVQHQGEGAAGESPHSGRGQGGREGRRVPGRVGRGHPEPCPGPACPPHALWPGNRPCVSWQEGVQAAGSAEQGHGGFGGSSGTYNFRRTDARCQDR